MCWSGIEMAVRLKRLQQLESKERNDEITCYFSSATMTREGLTVQGGPFNQNKETTRIESSIPAVLVF